MARFLLLLVFALSCMAATSTDLAARERQAKPESEKRSTPKRTKPIFMQTPEETAEEEAKVEALMDAHSDTRPIYPFEKPTWTFTDQICGTYVFAIDHGVQADAGHFMKATWAYLAGLQRRKWIYNPITTPVDRTTAEMVYMMCQSDKLTETTLVDLVKRDEKHLMPTIGAPDETNIPTAEWAMDRQVLDFDNVSCLTLVANMLADDGPPDDFMRQQDTLWAYFAGELAVEPVDIIAARKDGNEMLKEICLEGGDPETKVVDLMRQNHAEIRKILSVE